MSEGLQVVMSPVQLAAVLSEKTVTEAETMQNRLLGGLGVAMSTVELAGASILCATPEPTMLTKAACVVVGAHSMDGLKAAIEQTITGRDTRTAAYQLAVQTARQFGADEDTALNIGLTVDIAVPVAFGLSLGAARVAYVRAGNFRLAEHEAVKGIKAGGHTVAKHVAIPEEELLARLARSPQMQSTSSFYKLEQAEKVISAGLKANRLKILHWANLSRNSENILEITYKSGSAVGYGFRQGNQTKETLYLVRIVLLKKMYNNKPYYVLTAYPIMG
ncbi:RNase A-like domain-containing protein [Kosakonia radicincitans]|uniref:RNase A-like domain-containing protein n=1 Tax=Kosakonia radicincitans TaxID=283686 RepID=UPI0022B2B00B|nr:RNase A-like domain-containing protein [Kosakonia radicincitans]